MADIVDIHSFTGGMNLDADSRGVKPDQTREAWNCRYDDNSGKNAGSSTNMLGNTNILNHFIDYDVIGNLDAVNKTLGACFDQKRNSIIYAVKSTFLDGVVCGIYSVNVDTDVVKVILMDNFYRVPWFSGLKLNFDENHRMNDMVVVGDMLFWNDRLNPPRKIDIEKCLATGTSNSYSFISLAEISAIKPPPANPPVGYVTTDPNGILNNILGNTFLFKYRYVYDDFEKSVCSTESRTIYNTKQYQYNGNEIDSTKDNAISLVMFSGSPAVTHIELLCRVGQLGDWFIVKTFDKKNEQIADMSNINYLFKNDTSAIAVDQDFVNRPYDYLPDKADSEEYIDNKYMSYAGLTEGFDNIPTDIYLYNELVQLPKYSKGVGIPYNIWSISYHTTSFIWGQVTTFTRRYAILSVDAGLIGASGVLTADDVFDFQISRSVTNPSGFFTVEGGSEPKEGRFGNAYLYMSSMIDMLVAFINTNYVGICTATVINPESSTGDHLGSNQLAILPYQYGDHDLHASIDISVWNWFYQGLNSLVQSVGGIKSGVYHTLGLVYQMPDGKLTTVQGQKEIYVPFPTEAEIVRYSSFQGLAKFNINWQISHSPVPGAVSYHWVYGGRKGIGAFKQYLIGAKTPETSIYNKLATDGNTYTYINLAFLNQLTLDPVTLVSPIIDSVDFHIMSTSLTPYVWQKGDRIRFLTSRTADTDSVFPIAPYIGTYDPSVHGVYLDVEVLGYEEDEAGLNTDVIKIQLIDYSNGNYYIGRGSLVEIYSPVKNPAEVIYREIGETYPIVVRNGVSYHGGSFQDQNATQPATGIFTQLDICHVLRAMPYRTNLVPATEIAGEKMFWVESDSYNDFYPSFVQQFTRSNYYDATAKRRYQYIIRRSNAFFEDTKTNGLATFEYDKYTTLSSRHGRITAIREVGYTLKVIQENKQTSIYIGRNGLKQALSSGVEVVVATDNVFNVANPSELDFGCKNPESIVIVNRDMYYYDAIRKCIVQDDPNGPADITDGKVSSFIKIQDGTLVVAGYDPHYKEVYFTFASGKTIMFSQVYKNWKCLVNFHKVIQIPYQIITVTRSITVNKTITGNPGDDTLFDVTITGPDGYSLNAKISQSTSLVVEDLAEGSYTVAEGAPGGYVNSSIIPSIFTLDNNNADQVVEIVNVVAAALELTWDDIANVPVASASSVSNWNTYFNLPTNGGVFTSVSVVGNVVKLYGGINITFKVNLFNAKTHLVSIIDVLGCVINALTTSMSSCTSLIELNLPNCITLGASSLYGCTSLVTLSLPKLTDIASASSLYGCSSLRNIILPSVLHVGTSAFALCSNLEILTLPLCTNLGASVGYDYVFAYITGKTITLTIPIALMTCNTGSPDGDIQTLQANNTVTIITV